MTHTPSESRDRGDAVVRAYREADEPRVLTLLQRAFGRWPRTIDAEPRAFFRWKHMASPFGPSILMLAELDGELAGFVALMPWRLRFGDSVHETIRGVDLAVAPAQQRRGIATALIAASRGRYASEIVLGWSNPNDSSRPGVLKSGRRRVSGLARFVGLGGPGPGVVRRLVVPEASSPAESMADRAAVVLEDDEFVARALAQSGSGRRIGTVLDPEFLRWRYGQRGGYRAVVAEHPRAGVGLAIFRTQRHGRFFVVRVCELLAGREHAPLARRLLRRVRRATAADLLTCAVPSARMAARCGLVRTPSATMIAANPLRGNLIPDPTQASSWSLSLGDLELI